jgi:alpha-tubulin suppressor-like RCC1 family protein/uncharacterized protein YjdB
VTVAPSSVAVVSGTGNFSAVLRDSAGFVLVGRTVVWTSSDTLIAVVSSTGTVTARFPGQAMVTATSEGVAGSTQVVVLPPAPVVSVVVTPDSVGVEVGQQWQLSIALLDSVLHFTTANQPVIWTTSDSTHATVSSNGVVSAISTGTATISATTAGRSGHATVRVFPTLPVGSLTISPDSVTVQVGGSSTYTLVVTDLLGNRVFTRPVVWSTSNAANAKVVSQSQSDAAVSALSPGTVFVTASSGGRAGTSTLRIVLPSTVALLFLTPGAASLPVGRTTLLLATALDGFGVELIPSITWRSSDSTKATVINGTVTALATGTVTITASAGSRSAQSTITITPSTPLALSLVGASRDIACGLTDNGALFCWGQDFFGARGDGGSSDTLAHPVPGRVSGNSTFTSLSAGDFHVCAVSSANVASCWGSNARGQLGVGPLSPTCLSGGNSNPCSAVPLQVAGGLSVRQIASGGSSTCALITSAAAFCWGDNTSGQLGNGTTTLTDVPIVVNGSTWFTSIAVGSSHSCALALGGKALCWGSNSAGQTGAPTRTTCPDGAGRIVGCSTTPQPVSQGLTVTAITAGGDHSCALTIDGSAYCWGSNASGELGNGSQTLSDAPVLVAGAMHFTALAAGAAHTCGITRNGTYCWGSNSAGQLGSGLSIPLSTSPVLVAGGFAFESISAGGTHSCGVASHIAYCWGNNSLGQLGTGDVKPSSVPKATVTSP